MVVVVIINGLIKRIPDGEKEGPTKLEMDPS